MSERFDDRRDYEIWLAENKSLKEPITGQCPTTLTRIVLSQEQTLAAVQVDWKDENLHDEKRDR